MADDGGLAQLLAEMAEFRARADSIFGSLDHRQSAAAAVVWRLIRVASLFEHELEIGAHRPLGWSWTGFRIMYNTYVLEEVEPYRLALLLGTTAPSISSALATLERDGLIARTRSAANRRMKLVALTPAGKSSVEKVLPDHHATEEQLVSNLTTKETVELARLLSKLLTR